MSRQSLTIQTDSGSTGPCRVFPHHAEKSAVIELLLAGRTNGKEGGKQDTERKQVMDIRKTIHSDVSPTKRVSSSARGDRIGLGPGGRGAGG